jgi:hypothetical protein
VQVSTVRHALMFLVALGFGPGPLLAQTVELTIPEARAAAQGALLAGSPDVTAVLAEGLLQRDPDDYGTLMLLAWARIYLGEPKLAIAPARRALSVSKGHPAAGYEAATVLAKAAYDQGRRAAAIWWLRRASDFAQSDVDRAAVSDGIASIREQSPWRTNLAATVTPSSNVNGGSAETGGVGEWFGTPIFLSYSDDARAISGVGTTVDLGASYRVASGSGYQTYFGVRGYGASYVLTEKAYRPVILPNGQTVKDPVNGRDFAFAAVEVNFVHARLPSSGQGLLTFGGTLGQSWYAGSPLSHYGRIEASRRFPLGKAMEAELGLSLEQTISDTSDLHSFSPTLRGQISRNLKNADQLSLSLSLATTNASDAATESHEVRAGLGYGFGKPMGPFDVSLNLTAFAETFPFTSLGGTKAGERTDYGLTGTIEIGLPKAEMLGFVPTVSLSTGRTWSNVNRYKTVDLGLAFGLRSSF